MKKIILFGDSIFNGYRNGQDTNLVTNLFQKSLGNYAQVQNLSKSGATTVEGVDFLEQIPAKYDRIVVEYGNNDAATAWGISPESYKKDLSTILDAVGKAIVVGLCLPDPNNFEINQYYGEERLNLYNSIAKKVAHKYNAPFVDILNKMHKLKDISTYYQADGQHLTNKGNKFLVGQIVPAIKKKLISSDY
ncbi:SGNH/GDSL hydrolase family protein [Lactobacillus kefiranofaciens]|uniref:Lysophospholipase L1 n=1 Tax=Lactobacillus kefiranofaciens TaxID=267818 RepID=A0AAX3UD54_9LACO|nr:SGNH/GDSL hydrolase family protein [Lactobacillus kefiranofaciens]AEG40938.1 Arylesterase [Lactobacillus kefiranofaciens subsp. kefiranofaciens]KRL30868.1 arylesterase [Lactobacillus kefiranofaciens subsp. kefirgranum DSM 10550 = JCM 8572]KRM22015.1 arylesterase [Lactobacillus kefiranofaciens subsp. kefiranofaciens DSM 5016 = JCM 6985]QFQ68601.1 SGNH/GDSL hydrolase family protein [Lactobacillus kefiranofaciens subsp. kefiranofaciens]URW70780.1 SGNH/GDSL hydrolase family protein [Lactobacill